MKKWLSGFPIYLWISFLLTLPFTFFLWQFFQIQAVDRIQAKNQLAINKFRSFFTKTEDILLGFRAFALSSREIEFDEFVNFCGQILPLTAHLKAIEWLPRVPKKESPLWIDKVRTFLPHFSFKSHPDSNIGNGSDPLFPVYFVYPLTGNEPAVGLNLASERKRRESLQIAAWGGKGGFSTPMKLVQDSQKNGEAILYVLPVYSDQSFSQKNPKKGGEEWPANLIGFFCGVIQFKTLVTLINTQLEFQNSEPLISIFSLKENQYQLIFQNGNQTLQKEPGTHYLGRQERIPLLSEELVFSIQSEPEISLGIKEIFPIFLGSFFLMSLMGGVFYFFSEHLKTIGEKKTAHASPHFKGHEHLEKLIFRTGKEIQTPLEEIKSCCAALSEKMIPHFGEIERKNYQLLQKNLEIMSQILNGLSQYREIALIQPSLSKVNLEKILGKLKDEIKFQLETSSTLLQWDPLPEISGNHHWITLLFRELINNSLKFKPPASPLNINVISKGKQILPPEGHSFFLIEFTDNGEGIPKYKGVPLPIGLFQTFHKETGISGPGLGLALCQKIMEKLGGVITFSQQKESGWTASLYFLV